MTPDLLLRDADDLLTTGALEAWPRACAMLTRLAFEAGLNQYWELVNPRASDCTVRVQLLLLSRYADPDVTDMAREAWHSLCRAVHHHAYELNPTVAELRDWHRLVTELLHRLNASTDVITASKVDGRAWND